MAAEQLPEKRIGSGLCQHCYTNEKQKKSHNNLLHAQKVQTSLDTDRYLQCISKRARIDYEIMSKQKITFAAFV
jgi:hypothetical protein